MIVIAFDARTPSLTAPKLEVSAPTCMILSQLNLNVKPVSLSQPSSPFNLSSELYVGRHCSIWREQKNKI